MILKPEDSARFTASRKTPFITLAIATAVVSSMVPDAEAGNRGVNIDRAPRKSQPELANLEDANAVAKTLATSYTECHFKKRNLTPQGLTLACNDFKRATRFGSRHGEGENPTDIWGNEVDWSTIAQWLGLSGWLNDYVHTQGNIIQQRTTAQSPIVPFKIDRGDNVDVPVPPCMRDNPAHVRVVQKQKPAQFQWFYMPQGGTLSQAAQYHNTSVAMLQFWNRIPHPDQVEAGRALWVIPGIK